MSQYMNIELQNKNPIEGTLEVDQLDVSITSNDKKIVDEIILESPDTPNTSSLATPHPVGLEKSVLIKKKPLGYICRFFCNGCYTLVIFFLLFTIFSYLSDQVWLFLNRVELRQRFSIRPLSEIQELNPGADFTVLLMTQSRDTYKIAMPKWMEVKSDKKIDYILLDFESEPKIEFNYPGVHVVRKDPIGPGIHTRYTKWEGLAYAMNYIKSPKVFYFDACNYGDNNFKYETYLDTGANYYFRNNERGYGGNFLAFREDVQRLVEDFPLHIVIDPRTFFGEDWFLSWYFNSREAQDVLVHVHHEALANFSKLLPQGVALVRLFLYVNKYGRPIDRTRDPNGVGRCDTNKRLVFCDNDGIIAKVVALPGIYHIVDAFLKLEFIYRLFICFMTPNNVSSWPKIIILLLIGLYLSWCAATVLLEKVWYAAKRRFEKWRESRYHALSSFEHP